MLRPFIIALTKMNVFREYLLESLLLFGKRPIHLLFEVDAARLGNSHLVVESAGGELAGFANIDVPLVVHGVNVFEFLLVRT